MQIEPLKSVDAEAIAGWRYPGRYSTYDLTEVVTADRGFWSISRDTELVGYCCFGLEARGFPGIDEEDGTLDVGYAMRPDLVGQGFGRAFVAAVLDFAVAEFHPERLRVLILGWNERSWKVAAALGFEIKEERGGTQGDFLILMRRARLGPPKIEPTARDSE